MGVSSLVLRFCPVILIFALSLTSSAVGQGLVTAPYPSDVPTIVFHYQRPNFTQDYNFIFLHGSYEAELIVPIKSHYFALATVPIGVTFHKVENDSMSDWSAGGVMGNISLGFGHKSALSKRFGLANSILFLIRTMPTVEPSDAETYRAFFTAHYSDLYRAERFSRGYWSLETNSQLSCQLHKLVTANCEFRPQWSLSGSGGVNFAMLNAGIALNLGVPSIKVIAEYVFSWQVTPRTPSYYNDLLGIGVCASTRKFEPTVYYQLVLKSKLRDRLSSVIGIRVNFPLSLN